MKRFLVIIGVILLFCGIKLLDRGILRVSDKGVYYTESSGGLRQTDIPVIDSPYGYKRFDVTDVSAAEAIDKLKAKVLFVESIEGMTIYYCYSPLLKENVIVNGFVVNLMLAQRETDLVIGSPLIKGSY